MNIVFDHQVFYLQKYGGISKYFVELAEELNKIKHCHPLIVAPFHDNEHLASAPQELTYKVPFKGIYSMLGEKGKYKISEKLVSMKSRKAVLHETYYTHRVNTTSPRVITIHDMIYELFHHNTDGEKELVAQKKKAILEADAIIAVSENTKKDLLDLYPGTASKVRVVLHGVKELDTGRVIAYHHSRPYILFVGHREWYKNFNELLEVYAANTRINGEFDIICCGGSSISETENITIKKYGITEKVHFLKGNDQLLNSLYKGASALAYVSGYEGFGLPVLEAMRFGCPVLCGSSSSLPEVAGNAAVMINARSRHALNEGLQAVLFDEEKRKMLKEAGIRNARAFTWEKCAIQTHQVYSSLINQNG